MKKIVLAAMTTLSGLVMLFSYHTSTQGVAATSTTETDSGTTRTDPATTAVPGSTASSAETSTGSASGSASTAAGDGTYTGDPVQTRFGAVKVEITVANGKITNSEAVQYPNQDRHDQQINAYAVPVLNSEAVQAQSAAIDAVSGATVTSNAYVESLQSAIDAAHLG